jgi:hypothetical protein
MSTCKIVKSKKIAKLGPWANSYNSSTTYNIIKTALRSFTKTILQSMQPANEEIN